MGERPPEQERAREIAKLADQVARGRYDHEIAKDLFYVGGSVAKKLARAYLALLAAYEDRSKENKELREKLEKLGYDFAAEVTEIRERAAADCVRLEGALREIVECYDVTDTRAVTMTEIAQEALQPRHRDSGGDQDPHAHAEHLREARTPATRCSYSSDGVHRWNASLIPGTKICPCGAELVEQHQEEKHGPA